MQENKALYTYGQGIMQERLQARQQELNDIFAIDSADGLILIQSIDDVLEFIKAKYDLIDER